MESEARLSEGQVQLYEVAYLLSPALVLEEAQNFHQTIKNAVQDVGGLIEDDGEISRRRLSYAINKMNEAHLAHFKFMLQREKISEVKSKLSTTQVLRFLIVQTKRLPPRPVRTRPIKFKPVAMPDQPSAEKFSIYQPSDKPAKEPVSAANVEEIDKKLEEILGK